MRPNMQPRFTLEEVAQMDPSKDLPRDISHLSSEEQDQIRIKRQRCLDALEHALNITSVIKTKHGLD